MPSPLVALFARLRRERCFCGWRGRGLAAHHLGSVHHYRDALSEAVVDVCWKASPYGTTGDGDTLAYIVPKGALHRLIGAAQGAGIPAAFRSEANNG